MAGTIEHVEADEQQAVPLKGGMTRLIGVGVVALPVVLVAMFPVLAPVFAWPLLFGLPTWFLVARVAPSLSAPGRLGVAIVAGIELSAHATYILARFVGYGASTVLAVVGLAALATWALARWPVNGLADPPRLGGSAVLAALRADGPAFLLAGGAAGLVGGILALNGWHHTKAGWVSGGWSWSDLLLHVSIASSVRHGNFPPEVPYFSGTELNYHWFGDFHSGILATGSGVDVIPVMFLSSALLAGALALIVFELALVLTRHRRAALLTIPLVILGGGMGFIRLPLDLHAGRGSISKLISTTPYDFNLLTTFPFFKISSIFGTGLIDQRATSYGLPMFVAVVLLVHVSWGTSRAGVLLAGVLAACLAPFHLVAFPALYLVLVLQLVARRAWRHRGAITQLVYLFGPVVYATLFVVKPVLVHHDKGALRFVLGWPDAPTDHGLAGLVFFYVTNLGLPLVLGVIAFALPRMPHREFLALWAVALFLVPNVLVLSSTTFDGNKFFQYMWFPLAIGTAWLIRQWAWPAVAAVLVVSCATAGLMVAWHVTDPRVALGDPQEAAGRWIENNTPERSIFVTDAFLNSPVDLAGRLRLTTSGLFVTTLGYDPAQREQDVHTIYCAGPETALALMKGYGATYVLSSGGRLDCPNNHATDFSSSPFFERLYDSRNVTVWRIRDAGTP